MPFVIALFLWSLIPLALFGLPAALAALSIEHTPLVATNPPLAIADLGRARLLLQRHDPRAMKAGALTTVVASEAEINTAIAAGLSDVHGLKSRVAVDRRGLTVMVTAALPAPFKAIGGYLNIAATMAPSTGGLAFLRLRIGRLDLPSGLAAPALQIAIESVLGGGRGEEFLASISSVAVIGDKLAIAYRPPENLVAYARTAVGAATGTTDPEKVRIYYAKLIEMARRQASSTRTSLTAFIQPLFKLAARRSVASDPVAENRAAVMALSLFFGDVQVERVVGDVLTDKLRRDKKSTAHVGLDGRHDYVQHFAVSAGLTLAGGAGIAIVVGEAKEVEDSAAASGFSFTDLAADRAGIRFAETAIASRDKALRFQHLIVRGVLERDIFPPVRDLPEGLSVSEFESRFGNTTSPAYSRLVAEIDRRIDDIPLYQ